MFRIFEDSLLRDGQAVTRGFVVGILTFV